MGESIKTREEVEELKAAWANDPIWDIEDTEGFEEHHDELLAFRKEWETEWGVRRTAELTEYAKKIGAPGLLELADFYQREMGAREHWMGEARRYLQHYLGEHVTGDAMNRSDCLAEIGMIVEFIVQAAESSCFAHVALEIAKAKEA